MTMSCRWCSEPATHQIAWADSEFPPVECCEECYFDIKAEALLRPELGRRFA